ncbi:MAG: aspartate aminotransferase family protein [Pseudomonadota bacterium]|nr:aspartate aminotransferase family protein [Pseudomonadota bacterium]
MTFAHPIPNDLDAFWMPFTANRQFKKEPRIVVAAKDMHYTAADGRQVLDGTSGLWCVNAGHARQPIVDAIAQAAGTLDYAPPFQFANPMAFELASRVAELTPGDLNRIFFVNSGSEAVDTALKIAIAYHRARGDGTRTRLIGRERGYHGVGFGGISVGGIVKNRMHFGGMLTGVDHLPHTHLPQNAFAKGQPEHGANLADELERIVALHDASTIAAVIVEPMAGSTGVLVPPKGYLQRLREICDRHGILLIFDEVISGFGRLGTTFAAERFGVTPDIMTMAKGLTNAAVPMGAVAVRQGIHDAFMTGPEHMIELFHGYTYSAHPLACAAGLATLKLYRDEGLFARVAALEPYWEKRLHETFAGARNVIDVRNIGLVGAVELAARPGEPAKRGFEAMVRAFEQGLMIRVAGDVIAMSPPFIISEAQIDELFDGLKAVIDAIE